VLTARESLDHTARTTLAKQFDRIIADIVRVYPTAILAGAVAAAQYIGHANEPRTTFDVDVILEEKKSQ